MNYRREYLWKKGNLGDKLMDIGSYIPAFGLVFDNILNKKIEKKLGKGYCGDNFAYEMGKFKDKTLGKDIYHLVSSFTCALLISSNLSSSDVKKVPEKLEGPNSLEEVIKVIGKNNEPDKIFHYSNYLA